MGGSTGSGVAIQRDLAYSDLFNKVADRLDHAVAGQVVSVDNITDAQKLALTLAYEDEYRVLSQRNSDGTYELSIHKARRPQHA